MNSNCCVKSLLRRVYGKKIVIDEQIEMNIYEWTEVSLENVFRVKFCLIAKWNLLSQIGKRMRAVYRNYARLRIDQCYKRRVLQLKQTQSGRWTWQKYILRALWSFGAISSIWSCDRVHWSNTNNRTLLQESRRELKWLVNLRDTF